MSERTDLVVVGAGPAGSALAALAAAAGVRTVLLERERFPRDKVCGAFISARGCGVLARLGVLDVLLECGARRMDSCRITDLRGRPVELELAAAPLARPAALGISRRRLDSELARLAASRGADLRERVEAARPLFEQGRVVGLSTRRAGTRGTTHEIRAALVVGADGRRSALLRRLRPGLGDPLRSGPGSLFGLQTHLAGAPWATRSRVELHLFDGGYAGLAGVEQERLNLCLLSTVRALRASGSPDGLLSGRLRENPALMESIAGARRCDGWTSVGPLRFGPRAGTASGVLLVGDAAGTIDPYCGEGISNALCGAELAWPWVRAALDRGGLTGDLARGYARSWRAAFAPLARRARILGLALERPPLAHRVLGLLRGPGRALLPHLLAQTRAGGWA